MRITCSPCTSHVSLSYNYQTYATYHIYIYVYLFTTPQPPNTPQNHKSWVARNLYSTYTCRNHTQIIHDDTKHLFNIIYIYTYLFIYSLIYLCYLYLFIHLVCEYTYDVAPCVRAYVFACVHVTFTIPIHRCLP